MLYISQRNKEGRLKYLKAIGFDRDGTLWYGDPPGSITKEHIQKAKGYVIGGSSGQSTQEQERQWRENNLEPNFVVTKSKLPRLKNRFTELIHLHQRCKRGWEGN
jgi:hypothetical protein